MNRIVVLAFLYTLKILFSEVAALKCFECDGENTAKCNHGISSLDDLGQIKIVTCPAGHVCRQLTIKRWSFNVRRDCAKPYDCKVRSVRGIYCKNCNEDLCNNGTGEGLENNEFSASYSTFNHMKTIHKITLVLIFLLLYVLLT